MTATLPEWLRPSTTGPVPQRTVRVAFLARTSTDEQQDPTLSIPRQLANRERALLPGMVIVAHSYDVESSRKELDQRGRSTAWRKFDIGIPRDDGLPDLLAEATAAALAQRAGRANRRGLRCQAPIRVIVPDRDLDDGDQCGPYRVDELRRACRWLQRLVDEPGGLTPWALRRHPPPGAAGRRTLFQRPELADAWHWARTSDDLAAEPELGLWLADDLGEDTTGRVGRAHAVPVEATDAVELIRLLPPQDRVHSDPMRGRSSCGSWCGGWWARLMPPPAAGAAAGGVRPRHRRRMGCAGRSTAHSPAGPPFACAGAARPGRAARGRV